jgi:hypothetical protein
LPLNQKIVVFVRVHLIDGGGPSAVQLFSQTFNSMEAFFYFVWAQKNIHRMQCDCVGASLQVVLNPASVVGSLFLT